MLIKSTLFILLIFFTAGTFYAQDYNALVYKGNKNFENKKYDEASAKYLEAIKKNPKDFTAHYNLGNALYKQKMYKEAQAEYQKAAELSRGNQDKMASLYNQGNAMMQQNNHEEAAKYYKQALKLSPKDSALRMNYEIAMLKDKEKKQKNGGGGNDQNNKNQKGNQGQKENNQGDKKDKPGGSDQQNKGQGEGQDQNKNQGQNKLPKEMEKEILRQMGEKEKNTSRRILNQKANSNPISNEKRLVMNRSVLYILFLLCSLQLSAQVEMETYVDEKASYKIGQEIPIVFVATSRSSREMQMKLPYFDTKKYDVFLQESSKDYYLDDRGGTLTKLSALVVVRPKVAGPLKIGSAQVVVDNVFYRSEVRDVFVKNEKYVEYRPPIRNNNEVYIRMSVSENEVYVNEATMAVITAYSRNINSLDNVEDLQFPSAQGVKYHKVGNGNGEVSDDNEEYSMRMAVYLLFPEAPGKTVLPPASAKVVQGGSATKIKSNSVNLNVKPLPEAAPAYFQNAVGKYDARISVKTPGDHEINKPVSVEVKLSGVGNLKDVELPKFANSEYYSVYKPKVNYNIKPAGNKGFKGEVTANYIIVPKKPGNLPIALEGFSYFDPENKKYKQVALSTLPLFVQTAEQIASDKSTVETVMENTASVLSQKVKIPVIAQVDAENSFLPKSSENIPIWILFLAFAFVAFFLYFFYKIYNSNKAASPTGKHYSPHFKGMTNIEDSEKMIREKMAVDIPAHLQYLETLIQQQDYSGFFSAYSDMNAELEQDVDIHHNMTLVRYIEDTLGRTELEAFKNLQSRVEIVKFSPFKEEDSMKDLLQQVCSFYEKIEK